MSDNEGNGTKKFGLGVLIGTVIGGLTAFFLSPNSGPENREMVMRKLKKVMKWLEEADIPAHVKEIYGTVSEEGVRLYERTRKEMMVRMKQVEKVVDNFDYEKYKNLVHDSVDAVKTDADEIAKRADKLKKFLVERWNEGAELVKDVERVKKPEAKSKK